MIDPPPILTSEYFESPGITNHRLLWVSVILQAFRDSSENTEVRDADAKWRKRYRDTARKWLLSQSDDFRQVCSMADIDPDVVYKAALIRTEQNWPVIKVGLLQSCMTQGE